MVINRFWFKITFHFFWKASLEMLLFSLGLWYSFVIYNRMIQIAKCFDLVYKVVVYFDVDCHLCVELIHRNLFSLFNVDIQAKIF